MYTSHKTAYSLVNMLVREKILKSPRVKEAFLAVDRADFVLPQDRFEAYDDTPLSIGYSATISAPHMHVWCCELLLDSLKPGARVLDVGSGSGFLSAMFAHLVRSDHGQVQGKVVGIDHIEVLREMAVANVSKSSKKFLDIGLVTFVHGDGKEGFPALAPYDAIHVGAAAKTVPPALLTQLKEGGKMVIPVGGSDGQSLRLIQKDGPGNIVDTKITDVRYVPLL